MSDYSSSSNQDISNLQKDKHDGKVHIVHNEKISVYVPPDEKEVRKLMWKLDRRIVPLVAILYLCSFLDRVNIGHAKLAGIIDDLQMSENIYNWSLSIFFAGYVIFEIPANMFCKLLGPRIWLSIIMVVWGVIMAVMSEAKNGAGLMAARFFLGVAEVGILYFWDDHYLACATTLGFAFSADRRAERGFHYAIVSFIGMIGYILLITLREQGAAAKYVAATISCCGAFPLIPLSAAWNSNNTGGHTKRAVSIAFVAGIGNLGGILSGQMYRSDDAPHYVRGHTISCIMMGVNIIVAFILRFHLARENKRRDKLTPEQHRIECEGEDLCDKNISLKNELL
ncbi:hypothetical protein INT45_013372 [Circinella minor]|uniref:Major facilitator superfamily (MFS) profile domain-containing protein n=1 Tax=Circinella minor TaxID=1195481 RepID=A0A8H7VPQ2_9FUNG|nr:hypothetical protein INT45_013372 [Circinella minor]